MTPDMTQQLIFLDVNGLSKNNLNKYLNFNIIGDWNSDIQHIPVSRTV